MASQFVDLSELVIVNDAPEVVLASSDYYEPERPLPQPGRYYSPTREIKVKPHTDFSTKQVDPSNFDFQIDFGREGLIYSPQDSRVVMGAPRAWIDTIPRKSFKGTGEASKVIRYLQACGFEDLFSLSAQQLISLVQQSTNTPVYVKIGWTDDYKERPAGEKASYTSAFKKGLDENGKAIYAPRVTLPDGRVITARATVEEFINPAKVRA
jgi:hypothetical protein